MSLVSCYASIIPVHLNFRWRIGKIERRRKKKWYNEKADYMSYGPLTIEEKNHFDHQLLNKWMHHVGWLLEDDSWALPKERRILTIANA
jgi:hypothetical protein